MTDHSLHKNEYIKENVSERGRTIAEHRREPKNREEK